MSADLPEGFIDEPDFISVVEERALLRDIQALPLSEFAMRGQVARRRVAHFGWLNG